MPTSAHAGIAACSCVEVQLAKARADGVKDSKLDKMRPAWAPSCHRSRRKGGGAVRVNGGGKVVEKSKCKGAPTHPTHPAQTGMLLSNKWNASASSDSAVGHGGS